MLADIPFLDGRGLFVTGAHTDVGKTYVAAALLRAARELGTRVSALKPVVSGIDQDDWSQSDPGRLLTALGRPLTCEALEEMAPIRFRAALSPPMAARLEGRILLMDELRSVIRRAFDQTPDFMVVEGAGGAMSPVAEDGTALDLAVATGLPTILVGGSYLGSISHTLTALEALKARGVPVRGVVISQSADPEAPDFMLTVDSVAQFAAVPTVPAVRNSESWAKRILLG